VPIVADAAVAVRGDLGPFKKDLAAAGKQTEALGKKMSTALNPKNLAGGFAAAFAGSQIISLISDATNAAAEFQDSVSATGVIFGEEAIPRLEEWADKAHSAFGASKQDALAAANQFAVFGKAAGLMGDELISFSTEMVQLGGDLASMFGGTTQDAIAAVGSALRGENEPIRRYGVLLDEATLKQQALEMGIIETTTQALTPQQKVLAAHAEILEQTSDAQGDFQRTSDGMANTQRDLSAQLENVNIELGEKLMPVMLEFARWVSTHGIPIVENFVDALGMLGERDDQEAEGWFGDVERGFETIGDAAVRANDTILGRAEDIQNAADEMGIDYMELRDRIRRVMVHVGNDHEEAFRRVTGAFEGARVVAAAMPQNIREATAGVTGAVEEGLEGTEEAIEQPFVDGTDTAVTEVENMYAEIAAEMQEREQQLRDAGGNAIDAWLDPQLTGYKISAIESELASTELKENLASKDPEIANDAHQRRLTLVGELISLKNEQATQGDQTAQIANTKALLTSQFMRDGLASKDPEIRELFRAWKLAAETHLGSISDSAYPWGYQVGDELARGMWDSMNLISTAAYEMANRVRRTVGVESEPQDPNSPLRGITKWGGNYVKTIAGGVWDELGTSSGAATALASSLVPSLTAPGMALATAGASTGGNTYQWILNANGVQRVFSSRDDFMKALDDLGAFGEGRLSG
jgi:hypothetical protein